MSLCVCICGRSFLVIWNTASRNNCLSRPSFQLLKFMATLYFTFIGQKTYYCYPSAATSVWSFPWLCVSLRKRYYESVVKTEGLYLASLSSTCWKLTACVFPLNHREDYCRRAKTHKSCFILEFWLFLIVLWRAPAEQSLTVTPQ